MEMATDGLPLIASGGSVAGRSWPACVAGGGGSYETSLLWPDAANFLGSIAWASLLVSMASALGETLGMCSVVECEGMEWNHSILLSRNHSIHVFGLDKKLSRNHSISVFGFGMG
jgi:hypothetical protein